MDTEKPNGYTLAETVISLLVFTVMLAFLPPLFQLFSIEERQQEFNIQQFFTFISDELSVRDLLTIEPHKLVLLSPTDEIITIEKSGTIIRRQVGGKGHEILLKDIVDVQFTTDINQLIVTITTEGGKTYKKRLQSYTPILTKWFYLPLRISAIIPLLNCNYHFTPYVPKSPIYDAAASFQYHH